MIKVLVLLSLITFSLSATNFEVIVFRGQLPLFTANMSFEDINSQGITFKNIHLSEVSHENSNAYSNVVISTSSDKTTVILPLRSTTEWTSKTTSYLGVVLQSSYTTDSGDQFQVSIAFGLCNNDFNVADFKMLLDKLEHTRRANSAQLDLLFKNVKKEADNYISATNTLEDLLDDNVSNKERMDELKRANVELNKQLDDLNEQISAQEQKEYTSYSAFTSGCSAAKISESKIYTLNQQIQTYQDQVVVLNGELNSTSALTEEQKKEYEQVYEDLLKSISELSAFNVKGKKVEVTKGNLLDANELRPYFS